MPNIRIKDIPTTASATSSTDFIGIDGSANGTRKLNAYSPTFGGNLTASGSIATGYQLYSTTGISYPGVPPADGFFRTYASTTLGMVWQGQGSTNDLTMVNKAGGTVLSVPTGTTNTTLSGNLTVSGTGTSSIGGEPSTGLATYSGNLRIQSTGNGPATVNGIELQNSQSGSGYGYKIYTNNSNDYIGIAGRFGSATWTEFLAIKQNTGNLLIGTTTDGGQKLQVSGSASIAGEVVSNGASGGFRFDPRDGSGANWLWYNPTGDDARLYNTSGAGDVLTITNAGAATLSGNLTVSGNTANFGGADSSPIVNFKAADTGSVTLNFGGTTNPDKGRIIYSDNSDVFAFYTADTERMRLTSGGNLGIGVTPNAWSGVKALQITNGVSSIGIYGAGGNEFGAVSNCFYNGSNWIYSTTATATKYAQSGGAHYFSVAGSGTSGNTITFSDAMTLANNGNLGIGTTDIQGKLHVRGSQADPLLRLGYEVAGQSYLDFLRTSVDAVPVIQSGYGVDGSFALAINPSGGNVLIGTTTDGGQKLQVNGTIRSGSGSGETLSAGSIDVGADIGIASTQGIVQGGARIVTFTSGNATFAGTVIAGTWSSGTADKLKVSTAVNDYAAYFANIASSGGSYGIRLHTNTTAATDYLLVATSGAGGGSTRFIIKSDGTLNAPSLPTSSAGLSAGDIWNDGGTLKIV